MRIHINTQELNAGISTVIKALSVRTTVSILEGIYLEASNGWLLLRCTDLSLQIETNVAATVQEEGAIVLPGRLFSEMVRRLPGEMTFIDVKKERPPSKAAPLKPRCRARMRKASIPCPPLRGSTSSK